MRYARRRTFNHHLTAQALLLARDTDLLLKFGRLLQGTTHQSSGNAAHRLRDGVTINGTVGCQIINALDLLAAVMTADSPVDARIHHYSVEVPLF